MRRDLVPSLLEPALTVRDEGRACEDQPAADPSRKRWDLTEEEVAEETGPDQPREVDWQDEGGVGLLERLAHGEVAQNAEHAHDEEP